MPPVDEGMIHAWLDGALSVDEAARIEQLVASDPAWGAAAAEARGLIAASSRILSSLDAVPAQVMPASIPVTSSARERLRTAAAEPRHSVRRWRPQAWAAAAMLVVAAGAGVLWTNTPPEARDAIAGASKEAAPAELATAPAAVDAMERRAATAAAPSADRLRTDGPSKDELVATPGRGTSQPAQLAAGAAKIAASGTTAGTAAGTGAGAANAISDAGEAKKAAQSNLPAAVVDAAPMAKVPPTASPTLAPSTPAAPPATAASLEERTVAAAKSRQDVASGAAANAADSRAGAVGALSARRETTVDRAPQMARTSKAADALACYTVRTAGWTPGLSFPVPAGLVLDSTRVGDAQVARALMGPDVAPVPAGHWRTVGDSLRATVNGVVLGYSLTATVSRTTLIGTATLGDNRTPVKASTPATLLPSRCAVP